MDHGTRSLAGSATVVLALMLLGACTGEADPPPAGTQTSTEANPVTLGSDAERTIYLWDPETGEGEALFSAPAGHAAVLTDAERSPNGKRVVYERQVAGGPSQIFLLEANGTERPLTDLAGGAYDPTWSPDGETIAFAGSPDEGTDLDIFAVDVAGGSTRRIAGTQRDDQHPDWSPDSTRLVFDGRSGDPRSGRGAIWVASILTHDLQRLTPRDTPLAATAPAWSPDGRWIAFRVYHRRYTLNAWPYAAWLGIMRPDGSHVREVLVPRGEGRPTQEPSWSPDGRSIVVERSDWREMGSVILLVDPRTGEAHRISKRVRDADAEPCWDTDGILMSLWSDDLFPSDPAHARSGSRLRTSRRLRTPSLSSIGHSGSMS